MVRKETRSPSAPRSRFADKPFGTRARLRSRSAGVASMGTRSLSCRFTPHAPTSESRRTISTGEITGRTSRQRDHGRGSQSSKARRKTCALVLGDTFHYYSWLSPLAVVNCQKSGTCPYQDCLISSSDGRRLERSIALAYEWSKDAPKRRRLEDGLALLAKQGRVATKRANHLNALKNGSSTNLSSKYS